VAPSRQRAWTFRVANEAGQWVLQSSRGDRWEDLYAFTLEPQHRVDYELASHYTSTHPASKFTQVATAQRIAPDVRYTLRNRDYTEVVQRTLADDDEVLRVLAVTFGLEFAPGTRFRPRTPSTISGTPLR
jgi:N-hydroxyarylamine O-acetyltransferase